jgi:signal peptidase I
MKRSNAWAIGGASAAFLVIAGMVLVYVLNPFHTASRDPRARLFGAMMFQSRNDFMAPTITSGSLFLVDTWAFSRRGPRRGEIVVLVVPQDRKSILTLRVVATGGSTVEIRDGVVYLDGEELKESYLPPAHPGAAQTTMQPIKVPVDSYFVLGDNRGASDDSRSWGTVPKELLVGLVQTLNFADQ